MPDPQAKRNGQLQALAAPRDPSAPTPEEAALAEWVQQFIQERDQTTGTIGRGTPARIVDYPEEIPHPAPFSPQPEVIGDPGFQQTVRDILRAAPALQGPTRQIVQGPTRAAMDDLLQRGISPQAMAYSDLAGIYRGGQVGISPGVLGRNEQLATVGHELGHGIGVPHGPKMDELEQRLFAIARSRRVSTMDREQAARQFEQLQQLKRRPEP